MKNSILLILCFAFMVSCGQDSYWNEKNKSDFKKGCELSLKKSVDQSGVNVLEQLGTTVEALCDCQLEKTMKKYPDAAPDKLQLKKNADGMARECISELTQ